MTAPARGDSASAEASFERGRTLLKAGDIDAACAAFAASLADEFQYGTLYNLAGCEDKRGKLASAWRMYTRLAAEDTNPGRRERCSELAHKLWPRVPKLVVTIARPPSGISVRVDGDDVSARWKEPIPVDPGSHVVLATAPGHREWRTEANVDARSAEVRVAIELDRVDAPVRAQPEQPPVTQYRRRRAGHRTAAYGFALGGVAAWGISAGVGYYYKGKYDHAVRWIDNPGINDDYDSLQDATDAANHAARMNRWIGTPLFVAGALSLGVGVVLYMQSSTIILTPIATNTGGGAAVSGTF